MVFENTPRKCRARKSYPPCEELCLGDVVGLVVTPERGLLKSRATQGPQNRVLFCRQIIVLVPEQAVQAPWAGQGPARQSHELLNKEGSSETSDVLCDCCRMCVRKLDHL